MGRIRIATEEQRDQYLEGKPVYPLHGFIRVDGTDCAIEDLRGLASPGDPKWELMAPAGHQFFPEGLHTMLGFDQADIIERASGQLIIKCDPGCDCGWDADD